MPDIGGVMRKLIAVFILVSFGILPCAGFAADPAFPVWAYPVNPPGLKPPPDDGSVKRVPNSTAGYTWTQIRNLYSPPDWYPDSHPVMPDVVARGREPGQF